MRTRFAAPAVMIAAFAVLTVGCSASDEPADPASLTTTATAAPRTTTAATTAEPTTASPTAGSPTQVGPTATGQPAGQVIRVTVAGGRVTPPAAPVQVRLGSTIVIEVTSDVADQVHVHGYDQALPVPAGQPARLELVANIPGQFEVELESSHLLLFTLRVA